MRAWWLIPIAMVVTAIIGLSRVYFKSKQGSKQSQKD